MISYFEPWPNACHGKRLAGRDRIAASGCRVDRDYPRPAGPIKLEGGGVGVRGRGDHGVENGGKKVRLLARGATLNLGVAVDLTGNDTGKGNPTSVSLEGLLEEVEEILACVMAGIIGQVNPDVDAGKQGIRVTGLDTVGDGLAAAN